MSRLARKIGALVNRDLHLRGLAKYQVRRAELNWPEHQAKLEKVARAFAEMHPEGKFYVRCGGPVHKPGDGSINIGESWISLQSPTRVTGRRYFDTSGTVDRQTESGVQLAFHFNHFSGLFQVYIHPPVLSDSKKKQAECLIWYAHNLDRVDEKFALRMIRNMLAFQRVESAFQLSYGYEKLLVRYWRFVDARNRRKLLPEQHFLLTGWEITVIAGFIAAAGFLVSLIKP